MKAYRMYQLFSILVIFSMLFSSIGVAPANAFVGQDTTSSSTLNSHQSLVLDSFQIWWKSLWTAPARFYLDKETIRRNSVVMSASQPPRVAKIEPPTWAAAAQPKARTFLAFQALEGTYVNLIDPIQPELPSKPNLPYKFAEVTVPVEYVSGSVTLLAHGGDPTILCTDDHARFTITAPGEPPISFWQNYDGRTKVVCTGPLDLTSMFRPGTNYITVELWDYRADKYSSNGYQLLLSDSGTVIPVPPDIKLLQFYGTKIPGQSGFQVSVLARITDFNGDLDTTSLSATISDGSLVHNLSAYTASRYGADVYAATFKDVPEGKTVEVTLVAADQSGLLTRLEVKGYLTDGRFISTGQCLSYDTLAGCFTSNPTGFTGTKGNPILTYTGAKSESFRIPLAQGPGDADLGFDVSYTSANIHWGLFGAGMSSSLDSRVIVLYNPIVPGVELVNEEGARQPYIDNGSDTFVPLYPSTLDILKKDGSGYLRLTHDRRSFSYDADGRLTEIRDRNGNAITLSYDDNKISALSSGGRTVKVTYSGDFISKLSIGEKAVNLGYTAERLTSIQEPDGGLWKLEYEVRDLGEITDESGQGASYSAYLALLTKVITPEGRVKNEQTYDAQGRVIHQSSSSEGELDFTFEQAPDGTKKTIIKDAYGKPEIHFYDLYGRLAQHTNREEYSEYYSYNDANQVISWKDFNGSAWSYVRDAEGNTIEANGPDSVHEEWQYNTFNRPVYYKDGEGFEWFWTYDSNGNLLQTKRPDQETADTTYTAHGLPEKECDFNEACTNYAYDPQTGDLTSKTDPEGSWYHYAYDTYGRISTLSRPLSGPWTYTYDLDDNLIAVDGPNGYQEVYRYDKDHLLLQKVDADNAAETHVYDAKGRQIEERNGEEEWTRYTYLPMNEIETITAMRGTVTTFVYDRNYRPIETRLPKDSAGRDVVIKTGYDGKGNEVSVTDPLGVVTYTHYDGHNQPDFEVRNYIEGGLINASTNVKTSFVYDKRGHLLSVTSPMGDQRKFHYDVTGRLDWEENEAGERSDYTLDGNGNRLTIHYPEGNTVVMTYNGRNQVLTSQDGEKFITSYTYNDDGNLGDVTAPDSVIRHYAYNTLGQVIAVTENYRPGEPESGDVNVTTRFENSLAGDLLEKFDAENNHFSYRYDKAHRLTLEINPEGQIAYSYDDAGNLIQIMDANHKAWTFEYDLLNRKVWSEDPEQHGVKYEYDLASNLVKTTDPNGKVTETRYDALNRAVETIAPSPLNYSTQYTYNSVGFVTDVKDGNSHLTHFELDKMGRVTVRLDAAGYQMNYRYDKNGRLVEKKIPFANPASTIVESYRYDGRNLLTDQYNGENERTQFTYNKVGLLETKVENDGVVTRYGYNALRLLSKVTLNDLPGQPAEGDKNVTYRYGYNRVGNLTSIREPKGNLTTFAYNSLGSLLQEQNPLGATWKYAYDPAQNRISRTDALNRVTQYAYYPDNQLKTVDYPDDADVSFEYDANNNPIRMADGLGVTIWSYDVLNRPVVVTDSLNRLVKYSYDATVRRSITYPDGGTVKFGYLANDRLSTSADPNQKSTSYQYDEAGRVVNVAYANTTYSTRAYDRAGRLLDLGTYQSKSGSLLSRFQYSYTPAGLRSQAVNSYGWRNPAVVTEKYSYDALRRLTGINDSQGMVTTYGYDRNSNRTQWNTNDDPFTGTAKDGFAEISTYNEANQLIQMAYQRKLASQSETVTYRYDLNGNRVDQLVKANGVQRGTAYRYSDDNLLVSANDYQLSGLKQDWQAETRMQYDGRGLRLSETYDPHVANQGGLKRTEYTFDGLDPIAEYDKWNNQRRNYYRGAGNELLELVDFPTGTSGQQYWYQSNGLNGVAGLTKADGQSVHTYRYDAFGGVTPDNGSWTAPHNEYTLTGKAWDTQTGLYYFGARFYDPKASVWLTQDSFKGIKEEPLSLHPYIFNNENPINHYDPDGHLALLATAAIGGLIGGAIGGLGTYMGEVASNISNNGLSTNAFTNVDLGQIARNATIGAAAGVGIGSGVALAPAIAAWAGAVGEIATISTASLGYGASTAIGSTVNATLTASTLVGVSTFYGGSTCAFAPTLSDSERNACYSIAVTGGTYFLSSYSAGETIMSVSDLKAISYRGQRVYVRDINWDYIDPKSGLTNRQLVQLGRSPIGLDGKPIVLHHYNQTPSGPLVELESSYHQSNYCGLHSNTGESESLINRSTFDYFRKTYWMERGGY